MFASKHSHHGIPTRGHLHHDIPTRGHLHHYIPTRGHLHHDIPTRGHLHSCIPIKGHSHHDIPIRRHLHPKAFASPSLQGDICIIINMRTSIMNKLCNFIPTQDICIMKIAFASLLESICIKNEKSRLASHFVFIEN